MNTPNNKPSSNLVGYTAASASDLEQSSERLAAEPNKLKTEQHKQIESDSVTTNQTGNSDPKTEPIRAIPNEGAYDSMSIPPGQRISYSGPLLSRLIAAADLAMIIASGLLTCTIILDRANLPLIYHYAVGVNALITVSLFRLYGLYDTPLLFRRRFQFNRLIKICVFSFLCLLAIGFALKVSDNVSRKWLVTWAGCVLLLFPIQRLSISLLLLRWFRLGRLANNVAIVANTEQATLLCERVNDAAEPWVNIVGIFDDRATNRMSDMTPYAQVGNIAQLTMLVRNKSVDNIVIALPWAAENRIADLLEGFEHLPVRVCICPAIFGFRVSTAKSEPLAGVPLVEVYEKPLSNGRHLIKALMDYTLAALLCIALLPIFIAIAIAIRIDSKGPVLFRQDRVGWSGVFFKVFKFRTMFLADTDHKADQLTQVNDPRVTRVGRFLRRTSLDELPQLFNVLNGTMSLVGPRPHAENAKAAGKKYEEQAQRYMVRHKFKPGITGWAQVNGWRGETNTIKSIEKRTEYDLAYVYNWSLFLDLIILTRTLWVVIHGKNAH